MTPHISIPDPAESRIIRVTNVHYGVRRHHLDDFFNGYAIEDTFHTKNTATGKPDVAYILFATAADRNRALGMEGQTLHDRKVRIQPVSKDGNYQLNDENTAFVKTPPSKRKQTTAPHAEEGSTDQPPDFASPDAFPPLDRTQDQKIRAGAAGRDVPGLGSDVQFAAELTQDATSERASSLSKDFWDRNLQGQDSSDKSKNFMTPGEWYGFQANQYKKVERQQEEQDTNVGKILAQKPDVAHEGEEE